MFKKLLLSLLMLVAFTTSGFANTVGILYQDAMNESSLGVHGDYEKEITDRVKVGVEGQMQTGDNLYVGNLDFALTFNLPVDIRLESNNILKDSDLSLSMGRTNDLTASMVFPFKDTEWSLGVFGKNGNPFLPFYELADPSDPNSAELADKGIRMKDGSSLGLALRGELDIAFAEVGVRGLFDFWGKGDKIQQLTFDAETGGDLWGGFGWTAQVQLVTQIYTEQDRAVFEWERSIIAGVEYAF